MGFKTPAFLKPRPTLTLCQMKSEAQKSHSDTLSRLSAVVNEGKGAEALTEVTSAKNKMAIPIAHTAISPVRETLDKADCDHHSVSHLLSPVL